MSDIISSFRELRVYQSAFELQQDIFEATRRLPKAEVYALTDQIRRSSRSIGANLAEAWQKRRYPAHFISKLSDSDGEQAETQHWIATTFACGYITSTEQDRMLARCLSIGGMLGSMMASPEKFCRR